LIVTACRGCAQYQHLDQHLAVTLPQAWIDETPAYGESPDGLALRRAVRRFLAIVRHMNRGGAERLNLRIDRSP
jgi:hypothetical protein